MTLKSIHIYSSKKPKGQIEPTPFFPRADSSSSSSPPAEICRSGVVVVAASDGGSDFGEGHNIGDLHGMTTYICNTEDIGYYDYRLVTLLFACFISYQRYALS